MLFFDPLYLVVMGVGLVLSLGAQAWVKASVHRYQQVGLRRGLTGRQVAELILKVRGLRGVRIERARGWLSDHYDPSAKTLRLSPDIHDGRSVAAAGIAAHEVGHAIQDAEGYWPMALRQKLVPLANIGTSLGVFLVGIGLFVGATGLAEVGVILFAGFVALTLITLPVEIDASVRARRALADSGLLSEAELGGVSKVLTAAAATYVAAATTAVLQLLYYVMLLSGRRDD
jgi:Zn-dependent membrane protease YugP